MKASLRRLAAVAALAVPFACVARDLDADALARAIGSLKSNAYEARLFTGALVDGQLTYQYARIHRDEISKQVRDAATPLEQPTSSTLAPRAARAKALAARLAAALEALNGHIGENDAARAASREADAVASELKKLSAGS